MHKKRRAFTIELSKIAREIPLEVSVINDFVEPAKKRKCTAIIDTGATISVIPPSVAEELGLENMGEITTAGIHNKPEKSKKYMVTFGLPNGIKIDAEVVGAEVAGVEVLIGMNVISKGDFAMTHTKDGELIAAFAHPPLGKEVDFGE